MTKNIILLSDGTGSSAAKPFKTNVWRLYQALDIVDPTDDKPKQVAFYNSGVGAGSFKPLALLGQAFGIGLAGNVKDLYTFLCRNYELHDNIYLFGFSRGAFTVRILAGLILRCGLVVAPSEAELQQCVKLAYAEYKRDVARRAIKTRPWLIAGHILGRSQAGRDVDHIEFTNISQQFPHITFMGVWDTVDAYGMPIDELKEGIDHYIWPMALADRELSDYVDRVCHVLSLDDERPTFRPVLWNDPLRNRGQLLQVWFAGVHANVGGGYPDDSLAYVTLQWMMEEAARTGLRFYQPDIDECRHRADAHGQQYDSRAGVAGYYRYGPRDVDLLCADENHGVSVSRPLIHHSALERIRSWQVAYAPVSWPCLPRGYDVLGGAEPVESPDDIAARQKDMEEARDAVFRRHVAYLVTVALTVLLALLPVLDWIAARRVWTAVSVKLDIFSPMLYRLLITPVLGLVWAVDALSSIPGWSWVTQEIAATLRWTIDQQVVPAWAFFWLDSLASHAGLCAFCGMIVLWLYFRKSHQLQNQIFVRAEYAWRRADVSRLRKAGIPKPVVTWSDPLVRWLRTNPVLVAGLVWLRRRLVPMLFALFVAAPVGTLILPFFIPKFIRNARRRRKYGVYFSDKPVERISGASTASALINRGEHELVDT